MRRLIACGVVACFAVFASAASAAPRVLLVGSYHGVSGQFTSIQAAVTAAKPGDWILIGPGDYKTAGSKAPAGHPDSPAAVLVTKPNIYIRGMNRNTVIVDGTKPGSKKCSAAPSAQNFGPKLGGKPTGLNGIMVWKAANVWVQNLTACNFVNGAGSTGNEIWWNGGDGSGKIGGHGYYGSYLTATTMYFRSESHAAAYGIFSSNWNGGTWDNTYASNMNDSGYYIGACADSCFQVVNHAWAEFNALGYSGTNSGGPLLVENSQFDNNEDGFDTNSQNNSDWPSPQTGHCPAGVKPMIKGANSCWIFYKNNVHDNNNPNVPASGAAAAGPVGTGVSIEGRDDTVMNNTFRNNGAWGVVFQPYPDTETPPSNATACAGGTPNFVFLGTNITCLYDDWNNALIDNTFIHEGFFGNPSNGDFAEATFTSGHPVNCYRGNTDSSGTVTSSPSNLQAAYGECGPIAQNNDENLPFVFQALCDTQVFGPSTPCIGGGNYPRRKRVIMHPLPKGLATMPDPCKGVPSNAWCPAKKASDSA